MQKNFFVGAALTLVLVGALVLVAALSAPQASAAPLGAVAAASTTPAPARTPGTGRSYTTSADSAYLGVGVSDITTKLVEKYTLNVTEGVVIVSIATDSPAAAADLQAGDVVNTVNGAAVKTARELTSAVRKLTAGDVVTLDINRAGKQMAIKVTSTTVPATQGKKGLGAGDGITRTKPITDVQSLPTELQGLAGLSFDSNYGSTQTFKDANGNIVTVNWVPGTVTAISATSITITPNKPQVNGGPYSIDSTTLIRAGRGATGTDTIVVGDKVTIVVVGTSNHASIITKGSSSSGMHGLDMPFGGRGGRGGMDGFKNNQNQQQQPKTSGSGA